MDPNALFSLGKKFWSTITSEDKFERQETESEIRLVNPSENDIREELYRLSRSRPEFTGLDNINQPFSKTIVHPVYKIEGGQCHAYLKNKKLISKKIIWDATIEQDDNGDILRKCSI